ncbi:MAG: winged helix-turn-helix domain-containing protein [Betaproteobacteria bacterium]|nr:winged helix-turn-helix domain-containing protein [Betaproteobacteria bacterium]
MNDLSSARHTEVLAFGPFRADAFARTLVHDTQGLVNLTPKQFDTLLLLITHPGEVLDKDRILAEVWTGSVVEENNLSQAVSALRKALGDDGEAHRYILTVPRKGYRFVAEVRPVAAMPHPSAPDAVDDDRAAPTSSALHAAVAATPPTTASTVAPPAPRGPARWMGAVALAAILAAAAWALLRPAPPPPGTERSVAVLPFTNLSSDPVDAYFGAGMTEDMLTQLAQVSGLKVVSHRFAGDAPLSADRALGLKLGAAHFLQGTVRRAGDRLRISAQLIDAGSGRHLWAKSYDRPVTDVLKVQSEVAAEIAGALAAVLSQSDRAALGSRAQGNPELHLKYMEGRYLISRSRQITHEDRQRGVAIFEGLVRRFPDSPLGHVGLAAYHMRAPNLRVATFDESFRKAEAHVDAALRIDARSAEAHAMKAEIEARARWNWRGAAEAGARAVALNPSLPEAWARYAHFGLKPLGRLDEAERALRRALDLEPFNAESMHAMAVFLGGVERCDEAIAQARKNLEVHPSYMLNYVPMIRCHELRGEFRQAAEASRPPQFSWLPPPALDELAAATEKEGSAGYWRTLLKWQRRFDATDPYGTYYLAAYLAQSGDIDEAFQQLGRAIDKRELYLMNLRIDPLFKPLRADARWPAVLKRVNLL